MFGAALAAGAGIAVEQTLSAVWAMRRLDLRLGRLVQLMWRCVVATVVMAAVLAMTGLGWRDTGIARDGGGDRSWGGGLCSDSHGAVAGWQGGRQWDRKRICWHLLRRGVGRHEAHGRVTLVQCGNPHVARHNIIESDDERREAPATCFSLIEVGKISLSNRIAMAPLTRSRAGKGGVPRQMNVDYYAQRGEHRA